jgi:hypothetical protein
MAKSCLAKVVSLKFAAWLWLCAVLCKTKQAVNLSVHQDGGRPNTRILEILETEASITEIWISCYHKYPEAAAVVKQVHKVPNHIAILAGWTLTKKE